MSAESMIEIGKHGVTAYIGPDATNLFRAKVTYTALGLLKVGLKPTRAVSGKIALAIATEYTGKKYKRGQYDAARADLKIWIDTMLSALPIVNTEEK